MKTYKEWVVEEGTYSIMHRLLDKADRGLERIQIKINPKQCPEMYGSSHEETVAAIWSDIEQLASEAQYLKIYLSKTARHQEDFENAVITINKDQLESIRLWLNRPVFSPELLIWEETIERYADAFEDGGEALKQQVISCDGKTPRDIIAGFAAIKDCLNGVITIRQVSAQCFWGDSKFLDHRENLIKSLWPEASKHIRPRPLLMNVYVPANFDSVLFIENQDTFLMMINQAPKSLALVYIGGFRGTAIRIRESEECIFSYINNSSTCSARELFQRYWLGEPLEESINSYYWGDLDYAGMSILAALRYVFPGVAAWEPGYNAMVKTLIAGGGHAAGVGGQKAQQICPDITGCAFADNILLPEMERCGRFLDQEAVALDDIKPFI